MDMDRHVIQQRHLAYRHANVKKSRTRMLKYYINIKHENVENYMKTCSKVRTCLVCLEI